MQCCFVHDYLHFKNVFIYTLRRRSPKNKINDSFVENVVPQPTPSSVIHQVNAEKLSKEAFRLLRTVQNFLCTHEPILAKINVVHNDLLFECNNIEEKSENNFLFDHASNGDNSEKSKSDKTTDDESISADETRTDESNQSPAFSAKCPLKILKRFSATEDESGFSSMNSFHEVGLPFPPPPPATHAHAILNQNSSKNGRKYESEKDGVLTKHAANLQLFENDENMQCRVLWV
jgi:hypothetical protein